MTPFCWCPTCDLPLRRRSNTLSGTVSWRTIAGDPADVCPRCLERLPTERPNDFDDLDAILAEAGEPATCVEELERTGVLEGGTL